MTLRKETIWLMARSSFLRLSSGAHVASYSLEDGRCIFLQLLSVLPSLHDCDLGPFDR